MTYDCIHKRKQLLLCCNHASATLRALYIDTTASLLVPTIKLYCTVLTYYESTQNILSLTI